VNFLAFEAVTHRPASSLSISPVLAQVRENFALPPDF
jgi:hypothetical protein